MITAEVLLAIYEQLPEDEKDAFLKMVGAEVKKNKTKKTKPKESNIKLKAREMVRKSLIRMQQANNQTN